jgi:capsular polysaccharide transport system permease protein
MFYLGYFYMIWWSVAAGLIIGALSERTEWAEKIWQPYSYLYMFFSGFFVLAGWLPENIRGWALLQPSLQAYEMIRAGMFGNVVKTYGDPAYTTMVLAVLTFIGLLLMRESRKYVVAE